MTVQSIPPCDLHKLWWGQIVPAVYDGKTRQGPWAFMCQSCFETEGLGLGLGMGQKLILASEPADNTTHHMIMIGGSMLCRYCGKSQFQLGKNATRKQCPEAPGRMR